MGRMNSYYLEYEKFGGNKDLYRDWEERNSSGVETKVIMKGSYKGRHFMIGASNLGYPVAYVEAFDDDACIDTSKGNEWNAEVLGCVNGSSNYYGGAYWDKTDPHKYIGWDYGHMDDFMGHPNPAYGWRLEDKGHKWTLAEILMEIAEASTELNLSEWSILYRHEKDAD